MSDATEPAGTASWRQYIGTVIWPAFLSACLASMLCFAYFDPLLLAHDDAPPRWLADRRSGYALGFLFFWVMATLAASLTAWLIATQRHVDAMGDAHAAMITADDHE